MYWYVSNTIKYKCYLVVMIHSDHLPMTMLSDRSQGNV